MFETILARLRGTAPAKPLPPRDARHAMGALLLRMAHADDVILFEEVAQIDRILAAREGLSALDAAKMRARCEDLSRAVPETADLVALVTQGVSAEEREAMFLALWQVLLADGVRDSREEVVAAEAGALLGLAPDRATALAEAAQSG